MANKIETSLKNIEPRINLNHNIHNSKLAFQIVRLVGIVVKQCIKKWLSCIFFCISESVSSRLVFFSLRRVCLTCLLMCVKLLLMPFLSFTGIRGDTVNYNVI